MDDLSKEEFFNLIFPSACRYMHADISCADKDFKDKSISIFETLTESAAFKAHYEFFDISDLFAACSPYAETSEDLSFYLSDCSQAVVIGATLGVGVDALSRKMSHNNLSDAVIYDALASAYLEYLTDEFTEALCLGPHTFRFAPGYGDIPLEINDILIDSLRLSTRIGINKTANNLMLPQKSMVTILGIGKSIAPVCGHCQRLNSCSLRKDNLRCYNF